MDDLASWSVKLINYLGANIKTIAWSAGAAILIAATIVTIIKVQSHQSEKALVALYEARMLNEGTSKQQEALKDVAEKYSSTTPGQEAMLLLGNQLFKRGDHTKALEQFETLVNKSGSNALLYIAALYKVAKTQETMGKLKDAAKTYLTAAQDIKNMDAADAYYQAGRCYETLKDYDEAVKLYQQSIKTSDKSVAKSFSEERILWLTAKGLISG